MFEWLLRCRTVGSPRSHYVCAHRPRVAKRCRQPHAASICERVVGAGGARHCGTFRGIIIRRAGRRRGNDHRAGTLLLLRCLLQVAVTRMPLRFRGRF